MKPSDSPSGRARLTPKQIVLQHYPHAYAKRMFSFPWQWQIWTPGKRVNSMRSQQDTARQAWAYLAERINRGK